MVTAAICNCLSDPPFTAAFQLACRAAAHSTIKNVDGVMMRVHLQSSRIWLRIIDQRQALSRQTAGFPMQEACKRFDLSLEASQ